MKKGVRDQTRLLLDRAQDAALSLRSELDVPSVAYGRPAVAMLVGFPGVGKTHCARLLAARLGAAHVASDELRSRVFIAPSYGRDENAALFRLLDGLVDRLLEEGHRVIVDATHLRHDFRRSVEGLAARRGVPLTHVLVTSDEDATIARLAQRQRGRAAGDRSEADERVYRAMKDRGFEPPSVPYLTLRNGSDAEAEVARVARELEATWSAAM